MAGALPARKLKRFNQEGEEDKMMITIRNRASGTHETHSTQGDSLLCVRQTQEGLEAWSVEGDSLVHLDIHTAVIDEITGCVFQRDQNQQLWYSPIEEPEIELNLLSTERTEGWYEMGQHAGRINPRALYYAHVIDQLLVQQQGALPFEQCGELPKPELIQTDTGLRASISVMESWVVPAAYGQTNTPAQTEDLIAMVEPMLMENVNHVWDTGRAWIELIVEHGEDLGMQYAGELRTGQLCCCRVRELAQPMMRMWLGEMKHDIDALFEEESSAQVIGALLIIAGEANKTLPQIHVMSGSVTSGERQEAPSPERVIN